MFQNVVALIRNVKTSHQHFGLELYASTAVKHKIKLSYGISCRMFLLF